MPGIRSGFGLVRRHGWALGLVAVGLALGALVTAVLQNGDSAVYNDQIENGPLFGERTVHFGYLLLGRVFHLVLPGAADWQMNVMTLVVGTAGALAAYATTLALTRSGPAAFAAGLGVFVAPAYLRGSLASEVDVPLAAFVALAFACWFRGHTKTAAALYGYSMLVSPLASLALPAFVLTPPPSAAPPPRAALRSHLRRVALFGVVSLAVFLPIVVIFHKNYLYGGHGILRTTRTTYDLGGQVERSVEFFGRESWLVVLWLAGAVVAFRSGFRAWLAGVAAVALASVLFGERFKDVPVQLTTTVLAAPLIGFVVDAALSLWRGERRALRVVCVAGLAAVADMLGVTGARSLEATRSFIARGERERAAYSELAQAFPGDVMLVHSQGYGQARGFERVVYGRTRTEHVISYPTFRAGCAAYANERHAFWLGQAPYDAPCPELAERFERTTRRFHGMSFHLLVPRAPS